MKQQFTKQEKSIYLKNLRTRWKEIKQLSISEEDNAEMQAIKETGLNFSQWSFMFTKMSMKAQGLEGLPYIDCKTFKGWKENGYKVKKGEKSKADGITWKSVSSKKEGAIEKTDEYMFPKLYKLFHRSQVEEIK